MKKLNSNKKGVKETFMQLLEQSIGDVKIYFSRIIEKLFSFMVICLILVIILFLPFVNYNMVSDSILFLKEYEGNYLRNGSSRFF